MFRSPSPILAFAKPTEEKASKAAMHYRDYPKLMQMCDMCKFFVSGGMMGHGMMGCGMEASRQQQPKPPTSRAMCGVKSFDLSA